jgi:hypothetical protein
MGRTACAEPQCLYKGDLYLYIKTNTHFRTISLSFPQNTKCFWKKVIEKYQNSFYVLYIYFIFRKSCAIYEMFKKSVVPDTFTITMWRMRFACWIPEATDTHAEYVILDFLSTTTMVIRTRLIFTSYVQYIVTSYVQYIVTSYVQYTGCMSVCPVQLILVSTFIFFLFTRYFVSSDTINGIS